MVGTVGATSEFDESVIADAERRTAEACALLKGASRLQDRGNPLYALPWFLVLGDSQALLATASRNAAIPQPQGPGGSASGLGWWLTDTFVAAALGSAVTPTSEPLPPASWRGLERLLALIIRHRPLRPLDGVILCVPAQTLSRGGNAAQVLGLHTRRIVWEWQLSIGFRLPVFVIVTGLETLAGYPAVMASMPREVAEKSLGVRLEAGFSPDQRREQLEQGLDRLRVALSRIRLGLLQNGGETLDRRAAFRLPVEFAALGRGLAPLAEALLDSGTTDSDAAFLRAVYFVVTGGSGAHLDDLGHALLPQDAGLCARV